MEYGVQVNNKFAFVSDDEAEDPSDLIRKAEQERVIKTPAQKKAEKEAARKAKIQAEKERQAAVAASVASKENRPAGRGGRGRGRGGPRPPRAEGDRPERPFRADGERGEFRGRGRGRGGPRPFGGRSGAVNVPVDGEEHERVATVDENGAPVEEFPRRGGRGGFGGRGRGGFRGGRHFDRHSGSDRPQGDKKDGHGKGNWGTKEDEIAVETEAPKVASGDEAEPAPVVPREKTAEELELEAIEAEIAKQKTLAEYRATLQKEDKSFNIRKAGEGNEENFGKLVPMAKKLNISEDRDEVIVVRTEPKKKQLNIDIRFTETSRGTSDRGDRRSGVRGGRGRGAGPRAPRQQPSAFNAADSEAFPALG